MLTHDDVLVAFVNVDVVLAYSVGGKEKLSFLHNKNIVEILFEYSNGFRKVYIIK